MGVRHRRAAVRGKLLRVRFPVVPPEILEVGGARSPVVAEFLRQVDCWREQATAYLTSLPRDGTSPISDELAVLLRQLIAGERLPERGAKAGRPYGLATFPAPARGHDPERALEVLVWRSKVVDFLSDVWDTLGPAAYEMEECGFVVERLLAPALDGTVCPECAQPIADWSEHEPLCVVRRLRFLAR
jgi:hypothetical protein